MEVVGPARVMIRSGQFPSEMLMRAPLCERERAEKKEKNKLKKPDEPYCHHRNDMSPGTLAGFLFIALEVNQPLLSSS